MQRACYLVLLLIVGISSTLSPIVAWAVDVPVLYIVALSELKRNAVAGTALTFELHTDSTCTNAVHTEVVAAEDVDLIEQIQVVKVKGVPTPPQAARLNHLLISAPLEATPFLRVTGTGILPIGEECQAQSLPGIPGYQKIGAASSPLTLGPNGGGSITVQCPVGKKVLGGGGLETYEVVTLVRSYPDRKSVV